MNIENLEKALKAGATPRVGLLDNKSTEPWTPPVLAIGEIDISSWTEFWDFFDKPMSKSTIFQMPGVDGSPDLLLPVAFISVVSTSRERAVKKLRNDLYKLMGPQAVVVAFLAKPSVLELVSYPREGEVPDTTMTVDLRGGIPAKRRYAAFCFLHGYRDDIRLGAYPANLDEKALRELGIDSAVREGEVGSDIDLGAPLEMIDTDLAQAPTGVDNSEAFITVEDDAVQEQLYPMPPLPGKENILLMPEGKHEVLVTGVVDPVEAISFQHPEFSYENILKAGADPKKPGRELEEMRKYFGSGSGLYLVTVDFTTARTEAFKLDERAMKKIATALKAKKPKIKVKKVPARKKGRTKVRRSRGS